jgi:hypothetical protein
MEKQVCGIDHMREEALRRYHGTAMEERHEHR